MGALSTVLGRRLALAAIIWASLMPRGQAGCNETWAVNYNSTDDDFSDCHGPPHHLAFLVPVPPETVAGTHLDPAPVVESRRTTQKNKKHVILERPARGIVRIKHRVHGEPRVLQTARVHDGLVVDLGFSHDGRRPLFGLARHEGGEGHLELLFSLRLH